MRIKTLLEILGLRRRSLREDFEHRIERQLTALGRPSGLKIVLARWKRRRDFKKLTKRDAEFHVLHRGVAISATWLSAVSVAILEDLASHGDEPEEKDETEERAAPEKAVALAFFSRLASDLWAIIDLVERGFDIQARGMARTFLEHVDVLICCIHDRELTERFANAIEPDEANHFWHQHISKNKMKRRVAELVHSQIGLEGSDLVDSQRAPAELAGSSILHPTMIAGMAAALGSEDVDYESYPIFPHPNIASGGIFRVILVHLFWLYLMMGPLPRSPHGAWDRLIENQTIRQNKMLRRLQSINNDMHSFMLDWHVTMKPADD